MVKIIPLSNGAKIVQHSDYFFTGPNSLDALMKYKELGIKDVVSVYAKDGVFSGITPANQEFCKHNKINVVFSPLWDKIDFFAQREHPGLLARQLAKDAIKIARKNRKVAVICTAGGFFGLDVAKYYFEIERAAARNRRYRPATKRVLQRVKARKKK